MADSGFPLVKSVKIRNPFNLKKMVNDKESILDIKATDENGKIFNIEMQTTADETFRTRSLYYWARLYSSQLKKGEKYGRLFPVVCINILDFTMFRQFDRYHSTFVLRDIQHTDFILTDHLAIHFLELPKFRKTREDNILKLDKLLEKWLYYLKHEGREKEDKLMEILLKDDETFRIAHEKYLEFTKDDEMVEAYESHMKWVRDYNTKVSFAMEDGIKLGMEKGELIGRIQLIQQILQQPVSEKQELIQKSISELQNIFSSLEKELMSVSV